VPFGFGAQATHFMLLNLIFHHNVNAKVYHISKAGEHSAAFWPTDFVAIGIGPISYD
jgi:hypothetical protein